MRNIYKNKKSGFALFVAIGVASILLLISIALTNVAFKQILIASSAKESQKAFYAADNGVECVLFWEAVNPTRPGESAFSPLQSQSITCGDDTFTVGGANQSNFTATFDSFGTCVEVTVDKTSGTSIESRGRNSCDTNNNKRVERGIRVEF